MVDVVRNFNVVRTAAKVYRAMEGRYGAGIAKW